jgi:hypothetical protein
VFVLVDTTAEHVRRALQVQRQLAQRSRRGRKIPDLLIAAAGEQLALTVLHYDGDFDAIASVTGQRCEWVVPAGSVPWTGGERHGPTPAACGPAGGSPQAMSFASGSGSSSRRRAPVMGVERILDPAC